MSDTMVQGGDLIDEIADLLDSGDLSDAMALAEAGIGDPATQTVATQALAAIAFRSRQLANSIQLLELVLDHAAEASDVPELLAVLNCLSGRLSEALFYAKLSTTMAPEGRLRALFGPSLPTFTDAFRAISQKPLMRQAQTMAERGAPRDAIGRIEQHLELFPVDVPALDFYADLLLETGQVRKAMGILRTVLTLAGPSATLLSRMGGCLTAVGDLENALACHREAVARAPKSVALHAAMLRDWAFHPHTGGPDHKAAVEAWQQAMQAAMPKTVRKSPAALVKDRITIGYLCASALDADTKAMVRRIVLAHDRTKVKVVGFGRGSLDSPANMAFRGAFDLWRDISTIDELTLSALIRGEGTDVVINVDGLLNPNHFGVFARNCAPLQISWLNLPDGIEIPGAHVSLADAGLPTGPLLLAASGATPRAETSEQEGPAFGVDCSLAELNGEVARVWSAILHAIPNATLTLMDRGLSDPESVERLIQRFGNFGVAHRIDVSSAGDPTSFFSAVDVALAPFPAIRPTGYGMALSMGVPVLAMETGAARLLCGSLAAAGMASFMVAGNAAEYVAKAVHLAENPASRLSAADARGKAVFCEKSFAAALEHFCRTSLAAKVAQTQ